MIDRTIYANIQKIENNALRNLARLIVENWFYVLFLLLLWRFPYIVADLTDSEVMPQRPTGDSVFWQSVMAQTLLIACLAMSYNLLFGFSGVISFGHALFFGAGGYITFIMMLQYESSWRTAALVSVGVVALILAILGRVSLRFLAIITAGLVALILILMPGDGLPTFYQGVGVAILVSIGLSLLSGAVTLRLRGVYFTMFTLALAEMFFVIVKSGTLRNITGAEDGLVIRDLIPESLNPTPTFTGNRMEMYRITVVFFVIVFLAIRRYLNSPVGRVMLAIRENEVRARTIGYNTFYYKLLTMIFAGVIASMAGVLFVLWGSAKRVDPGLLSLKFTVDPLLVTLIGGVGTLTGPVIAALGLELGEVYLREETIALDSSVLGVINLWQLIILLGLGLIFLFARRYLFLLADRLLDWVGGRNKSLAQANPRQRQLIKYTLIGALILVVALLALWRSDAWMEQADLDSRAYAVSELWELFLGILFVAVVMVLPNGIVGTWNKWRIERRVRRMEKELRRESTSTQ